MGFISPGVKIMLSVLPITVMDGNNVLLFLILILLLLLIIVLEKIFFIFKKHIFDTP